MKDFKNPITPKTKDDNETSNDLLHENSWEDQEEFEDDDEDDPFEEEFHDDEDLTAPFNMASYETKAAEIQKAARYCFRKLLLDPQKNESLSDIFLMLESLSNPSEAEAEAEQYSAWIFEQCPNLRIDEEIHSRAWEQVGIAISELAESYEKPLQNELKQLEDLFRQRLEMLVPLN